MHDIFLSYSTEDGKRLMPLVAALEQQGWSVFWAHRSVPIGQEWRDFIEAAVCQCRCVLVVWSQDSVKSRWVKEEATEGGNRKVLLPIRVDDVSPPFGFRETQAGNFIGWNGEADYPEFIRLTNQVRELLGQNATLQAQCKPDETVGQKRLAEEKVVAEQQARNVAEHKEAESQPKTNPPLPDKRFLWIPALFLSTAALGGIGYYVIDKKPELSSDQAKAILEADDKTAWPDAVARLTTLIASGDTAAMQALGGGYYLGQGVDKDQKKGCQLYKQAVDAGDTKAKELYAKLPNCH